MVFFRNMNPPDQLLAKAANIYAGAEQFAAAIAIDTSRVVQQPHNSEIWTRLGINFMRLSQETAVLAHIQLAISCLKRAVYEDKRNTVAMQYLDVIQDKAPLPRDVFEKEKVFNHSPELLLAVIQFKTELFVEATRKLPNWEDRMILMGLLGEQGNAAYLPVLIDAIDNDPNRDVKMAAMKRLSLYPDVPIVRECIERFIRGGEFWDIEPYTSYTLKAMRNEWANNLLQAIDAMEQPADANQLTPFVQVTSSEPLGEFADNLAAILKAHPSATLNEQLYTNLYLFEGANNGFFIRPNPHGGYNVYGFAGDTGTKPQIQDLMNITQTLFESLKANGTYSLFLFQNPDTKLDEYQAKS